MSDKTMDATGHDHRDRVLPIVGGQSWRKVAIAGPSLTGSVPDMLHDVGMRHATLVHYHSNASLPCAHELLRVEAMDGSPLSRAPDRQALASSTLRASAPAGAICAVVR